MPVSIMNAGSSKGWVEADQVQQVQVTNNQNNDGLYRITIGDRKPDTYPLTPGSSSALVVGGKKVTLENIGDVALTVIW